MKAVSESQGANFIWALQPTLFLKDKLTPIKQKTYDHYSMTFWTHFSDFYDRVRTKADQFIGTGSYYLDLSSALKNMREKAYVDHVHYSPAAQAAIAKKLAEITLEKGLLSKALAR